MNIEHMAKALIALGTVAVVLGVLLYFGGRLGLGRLPGDIYIKKGSFTFYFPIVTSILASIILTLILALFRK